MKLFSVHFVKVQLVEPYSSIAIATAWKISRLISSEWSDFNMVVKLSILSPWFSCVYVDIVFTTDVYKVVN